MVCESPLHGPCNYQSNVGTTGQLQCTHFLPFARNQNSLSLMTKVSGNTKFDEDLHQALEENLSLFPVVQLKAELNFVIVKL